MFLNMIGVRLRLPLGFVVSHNLQRRHLSESQRAMIAAEIANLPHGVRADSSIDGSAKPITQPTAATIRKTSVRLSGRGWRI
jgi:hypothetical protein